MKPPDAGSLAVAQRLVPALVEKMTSLLLRQKVLTRVDTLLFHTDALQDLKADIQALKGTAPEGRATVDVTMFKDRYGVTRKFAIPLLEWLVSPACHQAGRRHASRPLDRTNHP